MNLYILFRQFHLRSTAAAQAPAAAHTDVKTESAALSELQLYNTMGRHKQIFRPRQDQGQNVSMYVCGVTVYDWYVLQLYPLAVERRLPAPLECAATHICDCHTQSAPYVCARGRL